MHGQKIEVSVPYQQELDLVGSTSTTENINLLSSSGDQSFKGPTLEAPITDWFQWLIHCSELQFGTWSRPNCYGVSQLRYKDYVLFKAKCPLHPLNVKSKKSYVMRSSVLSSAQLVQHAEQFSSQQKKAVALAAQKQLKSKTRRF